MIVFPLTRDEVEEAFRGVYRYQMSYWDALIWATAKLNGIATVLTEDIQSNGAVEGVSFVDPFAPAFDAASLGLNVAD
jgi:predicted nucleic acid-binding protein